MSERVASLTAIVLAMSAVACFVLGGGVLCEALCDAHIAAESASSQRYYLKGALLVSVLCTIASGYGLWRHNRRRPALAVATVWAGVVIAVLSGEMILRTQLPAWPARALHGVTPERWAAAVIPQQLSRIARLELNSWGQRDHERTRVPQPGIRRIAFIGDSFLEEGSDQPLSLATETKLDRQQVEVINLGVSATGPDEYFERIKGVASRLGAAHCYLFVFAGNDFVSPPRTLTSYGGIASVEPRCSLLSSLRLSGWNYALTNRQRPVIQAWVHGGQLATDELNRALALKQATDDQLREMLLQALGMDSEAYQQLSTRLQGEGITNFFDMLRKPDDDKFRSYYLTAALKAAADEDWKWDSNSAEIAWEWTQQTVQYCRIQGIGLTVVVIPEAFQVDDRMREQWLPLADMRRVTAPCRQAAAEFVARARQSTLDVIDLHDHLQGSSGTYLNLDGHWSAEGVETVSALLAKHWNARQLPVGDVVHER